MKHKNSLASLFITVAVLQTVAGGLWWFFYGNRWDFSPSEWVYTFYGLPYFVLAFLARRFPDPSANVRLMLSCVGWILYLPVSISQRHSELLVDGSPLRIVNFILLCWAFCRAFYLGQADFNARVGMPPMPRSKMIKLIACFIGIAVSVTAIVLVFFVLVFALRMKANPAFNAYPWFDELVHDLLCQSLICSMIAAVASAILTFCLVHLWPLMKERSRQASELKAQMEAEGKKWPLW